MTSFTYPTYRAVNGCALTQRELDDLAVQVLIIARDVNDRRVSSPGVVAQYEPIAERLRELGPRLMQHVRAPGRGGYVERENEYPREEIQHWFGAGPLPQVLTAFANQLVEGGSAGLDRQELAGMLCDPAFVSDEAAFAVRVLDRPTRDLDDAAPQFTQHWLRLLGDQMERMSSHDLFGTELAPGELSMTYRRPHGDLQRARAITAIKRLIHGGSTYGDTALARAMTAHSLHRDLIGDYPRDYSRLLGRPEQWPAGLLEVRREPRKRTDQSEGVFHVCATLDELASQDANVVRDMLVARCVRDAKLMSNVSWSYLGSHVHSHYDRSGPPIAKEGELLVKIEVRGDVSEFVKHFEEQEKAIIEAAAHASA